MSKIFFVEPKTGIIVETGIGYVSTKHPSGKYITVKPQNEEQLDKLMKQSHRAKKALIDYSKNGTDNALERSQEILENARQAVEAKANLTIPFESRLLSLEELKQEADRLLKIKFEIDIDEKVYDSNLNLLTWGGITALMTSLQQKDLSNEDLADLNSELERLTPVSNEQILRQQVRFNHLNRFMKELKAGGWTTAMIGKGSFSEQMILIAKNVLGDNALIILEADEKFSVKLETPQCSPNARKAIQSIVQKTYEQMGIETTATCSEHIDSCCLNKNHVLTYDHEFKAEFEKEVQPIRG